MLKDSPG